jgi:hypothetical protein
VNQLIGRLFALSQHKPARPLLRSIVLVDGDDLA